MARSDIERKIYSAFSKAVPDVLDSVLEECSEQKGQEISMTENIKKRRPVLRIAAVAAAVVLLLAMSVTVVAVSGVVNVEEVFGFTGKEEAFGTAATYIVKHADSTAESNNLAYFILSGMTYDISSEDSAVTLGLSGLRPVYHVKFKVGGYSYDVDVDAKTGVVISCEKDIDEGWEEHVKDELSSAGLPDNVDQALENTWRSGYYCLEFTDEPNPDAARGDIDATGAELIARDWFGLGQAGHFYGCDDRVSGNNIGEGEYSGESFKYFIQMVHAGYVYEAKIDSVSGEVVESYVIEDPEYDGDNKHEHTRDEEHIGEYRAFVIIKELAEELLGETGSYSTPMLFPAGSVSIGTEINTSDVYDGCFWKWASDTRVTAFVDAKTGEVLYYEVRGDEEISHDNSPIQTPSAEAPEGMISEAQAQVAVLDDLGIADRELGGFTIELKGDVYEIFVVGTDGTEHSYTVNAVSGEIIR